MKQVTVQDTGAVRLAIISNPPRGYMNAETAAELCEVLEASENDTNINALVVTGGLDGIFIRHYDVGEIMQVAKAFRAGDLQPGGDRDNSPVYQLFDRMITTSLPTVAAINGTCMGGGFEFALACDIRVAERGDYDIGLPETRLGIIPGVGGLQLLSRLIGIPRAKEMVMRGRVVGPEEAAVMNLVHELAENSALDCAMEIASDLAERPPTAVASVKRMANLLSAGESLQEGMQTAEREFSHCLLDGDTAVDKMQAFLDGGEDITADW